MPHLDDKISYSDLDDLKHALEISENKFRRLFEAAQDGILLVDPVSEKILEANPFLLNLIGYKSEEVVGKKLWEIGAFKDKEKSKEAFLELQTKKYVRYEDLPLEHKNGKAMEVEFVSNVYPINSTSMIQCNIRDITIRKRIEKIAKEHLVAIQKTNHLLAERQKSLIDLGNKMNKTDQENVKAIMDIYAEGIEEINKLQTELKTAIDEAETEVEALNKV